MTHGALKFDFVWKKCLTLIAKSLKKIIFLAFLIPALLTSGCQDPESWDGTYQGHFEVLGSRPILKQRVKIQVNPEEHGRVTVWIINESNRVLAKIPVLIKSEKRIQIDLTSLGFHPIQVREAGECFESHGEEEIRLCKIASDFIFDIFTAKGDLLLSVSALKMTDRHRPSFEVPRQVKFTEGRHRIITSNFESRIQLESQIQARLQARKAMLDLAPRLSFAVITGILLSDIGSFMDAAGNLLPFLFPSRWLMAYQSKWLAAAQNDALLLLRADLILQFESLYFTLKQLRSVQALYGEALLEIKEVQTILTQRLQSADDFHALFEDLELDVLKMQADRRVLLQTEQLALMGASYSLGFQNPNTVTGIDEYPFYIDPDVPLNLDLSTLDQIAFNRSLELRQIESLTHAAEIGVTNQYFSWFDPSSPGLGISLGVSVDIAKSQLRELLIKKDQMTARLSGFLQESRNSLLSIQETYPLYKRRVELQRKRFLRLQNEFRTNGSTDPRDLVQAIISRLEAEAIIISIDNSYSLTLARLRRLLFDQGYHCLNSACRPDDIWVASPVYAN